MTEPTAPPAADKAPARADITQAEAHARLEAELLELDPSLADRPAEVAAAVTAHLEAAEVLATKTGDTLAGALLVLGPGLAARIDPPPVLTPATIAAAGALPPPGPAAGHVRRARLRCQQIAAQRSQLKAATARVQADTRQAVVDAWLLDVKWADIAEDTGINRSRVGQIIDEWKAENPDKAAALAAAQAAR